MPVKMALGLTLGLVFWLYLLATGRRPARGPAVR
jgi:hypothetical protein